MTKRQREENEESEDPVELPQRPLAPRFNDTASSTNAATEESLVHSGSTPTVTQGIGQVPNEAVVDQSMTDVQDSVLNEGEAKREGER